MRTYLLLFLILALGAVLAWWWLSPAERADSVHADASAPAAEAQEFAPGPLTAADPEDARRAAVEDPVQVASEPVEAAAAPAVLAGLLIDVVDPRGAPIAGARVVLHDRASWDPEIWVEAQADRNGRAVLVPSAAHFAQREALPAVAPAGAFGLEHAVPVDLWPLPDAPVTLVLPDRGRVEVVVTGAVGRVEVRLATAAAYSMHGGRERDAVGVAVREFVDGRAAFDEVEASVPLVVSVREIATEQDATTRADGPAPGETRVVEVAFEADGVLLTGRLDADARELAEGRWTWGLVDRGRASFSPTRALRLDANGAFRVRLSTGWARGYTEHAWWVVACDGEPRAMVPFAERRTPGVHELGTLLAGSGGIIAAGRVIDPEGQPWVGVRVAASVLRADGPHPVNPPLTPWAVTDEDGGFELPGRGDGALPWCVVTTAPEGGALASQPVHLGERHVDIVLGDAAPLLSGRVLVDPARFSGADLGDHFIVRARRLDGSGDSTVQVRADGRFAIHAEDSEFDVAVVSRWSGRTLATVPGTFGTEPEGAASSRPPFLEFDLSDRVRLVKLATVDAAGAPVAVRAKDLTDEALSGRLAQMPAQDPLLLLDRPTHDVLLTAEGWRSVTVLDLDADRTVRFEEQPYRVVLNWHGAPPYEPGARLRPIVEPLEVDGAKKSWAPPRSGGAAFDERGRAAVLVPHPGRFVVSLSIEAAFGISTLRQGGANTFEILVQDSALDQHFDVPWDAGPVREILDRWREQRPR